MALLPVSGRTRVCFIVGDPIAHVRTPQALNDLFAADCVDAVMAPLHVLPEGLGNAMSFIRCAQNVRGLVVTIPHKTAAAGLCDELSARAIQARAVNVIRRTDNGRLAGDLLDGEGFVAGLRKAGLLVNGARVYMRGAGGAASAIAFALAEAGIACLEVRNRDEAKAARLVGRLRARYPQLAVRTTTADPAEIDIAINATSLGLRPSDALPFDVSRMPPSAVVADIVMEPSETRLLEAARRNGSRVQPGEAMLKGQLRPIADFLGLTAQATSLKK